MIWMEENKFYEYGIRSFAPDKYFYRSCCKRESDNEYMRASFNLIKQFRINIRCQKCVCQLSAVPGVRLFVSSLKFFDFFP